MNKRIILTLLALILLGGQASACFWPAFEPDHYWAYRVCPMKADGIHDKSGNRTLNNLLWQEQTSDQIPLWMINNVVYGWNYDDLKTFSPSPGHRMPTLIAHDRGMGTYYSFCDYKDGSDNLFAKWIKKNDSEAFDFLLFAKRVEKLREQKSSPWYYPCEGDELSTALEGAIDEAKAHLTGRYRDRYMLQLVRLLHSMKRHDEVIRLWDMEAISTPLMRKLIAPYVAGAYYGRHDYEQALRLYGEGGDVTSITWCMKAMGKRNPMDIVDYMATMPSVYNCMLEELQKEMLDIEHRLEVNDRDDFRRLDQMIALAHRRAAYAPTAQKAVWYYTEAYGYWLRNNTARSYALVQQAEKYPAEEYLAESIHILRLLNESRRLPLNDSYIEWLYNASQYLISRAKQHKGELARYKRDLIEESVDEWIANSRNMNYSCEYYTDMLRKITIGYAAPRLAKMGGTLRALQITDMADYTLIQSVRPNHHSHSFGLADTMRTNTLKQFIVRMETPQDKYDRFFNSEGSSYCKEYWYELLGTKLLRECRYQEAVHYLSKVSLEYNRGLKIAPYFDRNPFALEFLSDSYCRSSKVMQTQDDNYKLHFAQRMAKLEGYASRRDPDVRASMELEYAVGMSNSYYPCWALTQYYRGNFYFYNSGDRLGDDCRYTYDEESGDFLEIVTSRHAKLFTPLRERSERLMKEALATFRNKELAARAQWSLGRYKTVARHYAHTAFARDKRGQCDRWDMYVQGDAAASTDTSNSR